MTGDVMMSRRPDGEGPRGSGPTGVGCARGCPIHVPGQSALAGAILGTIGGVIAGLVEGLLTSGQGPDLDRVFLSVGLFAGLAGLASLVAGLVLGTAGVRLRGTVRVMVFAALLLGLAGVGVGALGDDLQGSPRRAAIGIATGIVLGCTVGVGRAVRTQGLARLHAKRPTPSLVQVLVGGMLWALAAGGALFVADIPGEFGESLCGVWGCLPPVQALAAMHLFWFVALTPVVWAIVRFRPQNLCWVGGLLIVLALGVGLVVVGRDLSVWLGWASDEYRAYWPKRALYTLVTLSDVPLIQLLFAGLVCVTIGMGRGPSGHIAGRNQARSNFRQEDRS